MVLDVGDLPVELTSTPLAYVALIGLDIVENPVHKAIWESFTVSRADRPPLFLRLLPEGYEFPKAKQKRTSYDWYVPKGILKTNWMSKHLTEVPALAVQFMDLDWDSPAWPEKRAECAQKLENLRASLQGRSTRVALVLIQKRATLPGTDDQVAAERAAFLCSACDLSGKTLFVLPHSDHLFGYTLRLQNAFCELAQTYYHHESRRIRNHREHLNKTTHQLLFVRHQFKIAFLSELKQEASTALKNYKQAYANLMEVRATDANMLEIKTVAGFINYKMCRLSFMSCAPLDAIAQFRKHIDILKNKVGPQNLAFEHSAWMAKQFSHFGDLFEEAVQQGLNAIQTQHPGFYYQQAANHAMTRKTLCQKLCRPPPESPNLSVLDGADGLEFYGQRPWRPCCQSLEPPDPQLELEGIRALQFKEQEVDHSMIIIPLLSSAVTQFKKYKCRRMKRQLIVEMGQEYFYCKDYAKALTLLKHVLWDYRIEKWRPIVSSTLWLALKCAYLSANVQEYIFLGLEAISYWILHSSEEKSAIQGSINNLIQRNPPGAIPGLSEQENKEAEIHWSESLSSLTLPMMLTVEMASAVPFIECRAGFACQDYVLDQRVSVTTYIRMNCPLPMSFTKLTVMFNNRHYNQYCEVPSSSQKKKAQDASACKINLVPRNTHTYSFSFIPDPHDTGKDIQVSSVALQLGSEDGLCVVLHWAGSGPDALSPRNVHCPYITKAASFSDEPSFYHIMLHPTTRILPRNAKMRLEISHEPPALINEFYVFSVEVTNEESSEISNVFLSVGLKEGQLQSIHDTTFLTEDCESPDKFGRFLPNIPLKTLPPEGKVTKRIFLKASAVGERKLLFEVKYDINVEVDEQKLQCSCKKTEDIELKVEEPFEFSVKILSMKYQVQQYVRSEEPFLLKIDITSCSQIPVTFDSANLILVDGIKSVDEEIVSDVQNLSLMPKEVGGECFCLVTTEGCPPSTSFGRYCLKWRRTSSQEDACMVETVTVLPVVEVVRSPVYLELEHPAHGWVRTPMTMTYTLHNRLLTVQEFGLQVDGSEAFMFSGNKEMNFKVLPKSHCKLMYNLYPLTPGYVPLPRMHLIMNPRQPNAQSIDDLIQEMVPSHLFVMPKGKSVAESTPAAS